MASYLDIEAWPRRHLFRFFRTYDQPFFNICANVDVTALRAYAKSTPGASFSLAALYLSLRVANELEPFRYRLRGDRVLVHDRVHANSTVLRDDDVFVFGYFPHEASFDAFQRRGKAEIVRLKASDAAPDPLADRDDMIYYSVIPWISFTSFAHARRSSRDDAVPRIVFGRYVERDGRTLMPVSVEVHHALMDGVHVGRYFERLEAAFAHPLDHLAAPTPTLGER